MLDPSGDCRQHIRTEIRGVRAAAMCHIRNHKQAREVRGVPHRLVQLVVVRDQSPTAKIPSFTDQTFRMAPPVSGTRNKNFAGLSGQCIGSG